MINAKYRVRDVAKDLDVKTNYVTELIEKNFGGAKKSSMTALESDELDLLFDTVTKENAVDSFDEYFALKSKNEAPAKKEAPAAEQKSEQKEAAAKPAQKSAPAKDTKPAAKAEKPAAKAQEQAAKPAEDRPKKKNNNKPMQSRTKGERRTVDTRAGNVELDKYNERYENIAPANNGMQNDRSVHKQKLKQRSTQYRKQGMRSSRRETEAQRLARIAAERAKKPQIVVKIPDEIVVSDLAAMLKMTAAEVVKKLFSLGVMATVNQVIDYDTAAIVATELGAKAEKEVVVTIEDRIIDDSDDSAEDLSPRDPVVVVMGHVDHGKTSLLDAIRHTDVTATEAGGITQHIGAYRVDLNGQKITFLDTPGHAAFTSMRARGAQATDIAVLVVAADDGIMPQTIEAINHAKAAGVDIIVAINKMDKPGVTTDRIMQQLTEYDLIPEEWGGDTICVPVSAVTKMNIDKLLEAILLVAEMKELKANPNRAAKGIVIEARLDKNRGPIATLLVQNGTLHSGDIIVAGTSVGRVRVMVDDKGRKVNEAGPSVPVEIMGLAEAPQAGESPHRSPAPPPAKPHGAAARRAGPCQARLSARHCPPGAPASQLLEALDVRDHDGSAADRDLHRHRALNAQAQRGRAGHDLGALLAALGDDADAVIDALVIGADQQRHVARHQEAAGGGQTGDVELAFQQLVADILGILFIDDCSDKLHGYPAFLLIHRIFFSGCGFPSRGGASSPSRRQRTSQRPRGHKTPENPPAPARG